VALPTERPCELTPSRHRQLCQTQFATHPDCKAHTALLALAQVVRLATEEGLVTPYTSAVGVMLHNNPLDPKLTKAFEVRAPCPR